MYGCGDGLCPKGSPHPIIARENGDTLMDWIAADYPYLVVTLSYP